MRRAAALVVAAVAALVLGALGAGAATPLNAAPKALGPTCARLAHQSGLRAWCPDRLPPGAAKDGLCTGSGCLGTAQQGGYLVLSKGRLYGFAAVRSDDLFLAMGLSIGQVQPSWRAACTGRRLEKTGVSVGGAATGLLSCSGSTFFVVWSKDGVAYALHAPTADEAKAIARRLHEIRP